MDIATLLKNVDSLYELAKTHLIHMNQEQEAQALEVTRLATELNETRARLDDERLALFESKGLNERLRSEHEAHLDKARQQWQILESEKNVTIKRLQELLATSQAQHAEALSAVAHVKDTEGRRVQEAQSKINEKQTAIDQLLEIQQVQHQQTEQLRQDLTNSRLAREKFREKAEGLEQKLDESTKAIEVLRRYLSRIEADGAQAKSELERLTRERDNLADKNWTMCQNAAEDAETIRKLQEKFAAKTAGSPAPRHPIAVPNSAAKTRDRRSLSAPIHLDLATVDDDAAEGEEGDAFTPLRSIQNSMAPRRSKRLSLLPKSAKI